MRDYEKQIKNLRYCSKPGNCNLRCPRFSFAEDCLGKLTKNAADAIEELCSVLREIASAAMIYDSEQATEVILRKLRTAGFAEADEGGFWRLAEGEDRPNA